MLLNLDRAREVMDAEGLDALVATAPENVYYLSNFGFSHVFIFAQYGVAAAILPRDISIPPTLLIGEVDVPYLEVNPTWMPEVRMIGSFGSAAEAPKNLSAAEGRIVQRWAELARRGERSPNRQHVLGGIIREYGLDKSNLGFDDVRVMLEMRDSGIGMETGREVINVFRKIRLVKTAAELALLRNAATINQHALRTAADLLREGVTMREVKNAWKVAFTLAGGMPMEFYAGGFDRPWPMGDEKYVLKNGDHVLLDCAGTYKWYWADVGRTGTVGEPNPRVVEVHEGLKEIYRECVPMMRHGVNSADIKMRAMEVAPTNVRDHLIALMHPFGVEIYEMPQPYGEIEREDFSLEAGMVVNFECCLYMEFPWGVCQLEDTFLITHAEPEWMGVLPQDLIVGG